MRYEHSNSYIAHHGIKGQKWGVRRFQNEDGTLTAEGLKRYNEDGTRKGIIQRRKETLISKYVAEGKSQEAAKSLADQRVRTEAALAVIGAVAVTAVVATNARKIGQDYFDKTFKSGVTIQNVGPAASATFQDTPFYAAVNKADKKLYGKVYPAEKRTLVEDAWNRGRGPAYSGIYKNEIKLTKDVKRASSKNAQKIFYDKMSKDPSFKEGVIDALKETAYYNPQAVDAFERSGVKSRKLYDKFNQALATPQMQSRGLNKQYYDELKKHGYNAIVDINDTRYSGYSKLAKSPTIFFGNDKWEKISSIKYDDNLIDSDAAEYGHKRMMALLAKEFGKRSAIIVGGSVALNQTKKYRIVDNYLKEHPNSKLSRDEILTMYQYEKMQNN